MKTRFRLNYDFLDQLTDEKLAEAATKELLRSGGNPDDKFVHPCDDLALREEWLQECQSVVLVDITLYYTSVCVMALKAQYRCEYDDSKILLKQGPMHYFAKGLFSFQCGENSSEDIIQLKITRKESIIKVRPERNGEKGKAVTVSTSNPSISTSI
ncbi:expressed unknown protein [Seminavis robusta]|uniref:Uncharacterized protein n=1 Tax=Seminavis robusta TaxID=568900 RepID=A0A9N8HPT1_9STRA|nr:expressed unknown protein [Seminavis robusta]|eukprot:Sro1125_g243900.1 n/a (156) ;mRNA; f:12309-12776